MFHVKLAPYKLVDYQPPRYTYIYSFMHILTDWRSAKTSSSNLASAINSS